MLEHIKGIKWVGGLSLEDADVLAMMGKRAQSILEFGVGGSTLIFSQVLVPQNGKLVSIDTVAPWIEEVKKRMALIENHVPVEYCLVDEIPLLEASGCKFDLIFIDGLWKRRLDVALKTWSMLSPGGKMMFHDTRKQQDVLMVQDLLCQRITDVEMVQYNLPASNGADSCVTIITKRDVPFVMHRHQYIDQQSVEENRDLWTFGRMEDYKIDRGLYQYKGS